MTSSTPPSSAPIELYGSPLSTCTQRVLAVLYFYECPFEFRDVARDPAARAFVKAQPFAQIPVLRHGDVLLYESRAILRYLEHELAPRSDKRLLPLDAATSAQAEMWLAVESDSFKPAVKAIIVELRGWVRPVHQNAGAPDAHAQKAEAFEAAKDKLTTLLDIYERHLSTHRFLAGADYTLADLAHTMYLNAFVGLGGQWRALIERRPSMRGWWQELSCRPEWRKTLQLASRSTAPAQ
eukprot:TRINITY_DN11806_c0_g1_i1.p1 TRINITY_DN11806_c0_g1~~TRINITY_DN11806_c0_g1_i1.p1  ORF type:complete len:260 (-),score=29.89 TRINITY_DN11806_c0_g1_i1:95-808(-)